jgi:uncharacterized protein (TIGR02246 family)
VSSDSEQAIRALFEQSYPQAVAAADRQAYLALYTPDALWLRPGDLPRRGLAAIGEGFEQMIAGHAIQPTFVAEEIERHGGSATVLGHAQAEVRDLTSGQQSQQRFAALWIVRQHGESWLIHRQIWTPQR